MKLSLKPLFALLALSMALGSLTFGCSKPADDTAPTPPATGNSAAKPDNAVAAPPKTHD